MLSKQDARGEIQGYYILYKRKNDPQLPWKNRTVNRKETTSKVVTSLKKFTSYEFAIQAFNNKDVSVKSDIIETKTDQDGKFPFIIFSNKFPSINCLKHKELLGYVCVP